MDSVNRRSVIRFLLAVSFSVLPAAIAVSAAQEPVVMETTEPPTLLSCWACNWTVICYDSQGNQITTTGTETSPGSPSKAEAKAETQGTAYLNSSCPMGPRTLSVGSAYPCGYAASEIERIENPCSSPCQSMGEGEWVVYFQCTTRNGNLISKESRGRTYCEALANARASVYRMIKCTSSGGACRCCSRVVERPVCDQHCAPCRKR